MAEFSAALRDALLIDDVRISEDTVRQIVVNQIKELDPQAVAISTGYFNHSWIPDLTIRWKDEADRSLFLRFDVNQPGFSADLDYAAGADASVFLDIAQPELHSTMGPAGPTTKATSASDTGLIEKAVMVTEHQALGRLGNGVSGNRDVRNATKQVIRGGRGYVGVEAADTVVDYYQRAAEALSPLTVGEADPEALREILDVLEQPLSRVARLDLETEFRARWVNGGREPETFPSLEGWQLSDRSPDEIATLVIALASSDEVIPDTRWREIARAVTLDALGSAARGRRRLTGGKINDLVRVARPYWTARWAWVGSVNEESPGFGTLDWALGGTSVELYLERARAVFVDVGTRLNTLPRPDELPFLEPRLVSLQDPSVKGITIVTSEETVGLHLRASATETLGERLRQLMAEQAEVRISGRVETLEVQVPGSTENAIMRFDTGKVQAPGAVSAVALSQVIARFMVALSPEQLRRLD